MKRLLTLRLTKTNASIWVISFWLASFLLVNPIGDFPLNDDWAYALSLKKWLDSGQFQIIDWPAMSLGTQLAWGAVWAKVFGFSFTVLRFSTICLAVIGLWIFGRLLRELHFAPEQQLLFLAVIGFNPLFYHLSATYMTDVPFLSICLLGAYAYWRYLQDTNWRWWLLATLAAVAATLLRQLGLLLPLCFGLATVLHRFNLRTWTQAILGVLLTYGSLQLYLWYLDTTTGLPSTFTEVGSVGERLRLNYIWQKGKEVLGFYALYVGGYLLPAWIVAGTIRRHLLWLLIFGASLPITAYLLWQCWPGLPLWNTVYNWGVGPMNLTDFLRGYSTTQFLSPWLLSVLKGGALLGVLGLLWYLAQGGWRLLQRWRIASPTTAFRLGVLGFLVAYGIYLVIDYYHFDRYMLPLLPFTLLLLRPQAQVKKFVTLVGLLLLLPMAWFSVAATHDYLAWNRVRWQALRTLEADGISPQEIDGGFEYNGWHQTHPRNPDNRFAKSWWFVDDDRYAIAFAPYKNYRVSAVYPFYAALRAKMDSVLVLERPAFVQEVCLAYLAASTRDSQWIRFQPSLYAPQRLPTNLDVPSSADIWQIDSTQVYALQHQLYPVKAFERISVAFYLKGAPKGFTWVNSAPQVDSFYYGHTPFIPYKQEWEWQRVVMEMQIPADYPSDTLDLYLWQQSPQNLIIKDFSLRWQRY
ncbi:MAG: hypothetical protein D6772_17385 [Bacteroidetes bacterium]|nr:MAG: hypothetical protein D6772_17385 [Bacteroidota bacterium]